MSFSDVATKVTSAADHIGGMMGMFGLPSVATEAVVSSLKLAGLAIKLFGPGAPKHIQDLYGQMEARHSDTEARRLTSGEAAFAAAGGSVAPDTLPGNAPGDDDVY